MSKGKLETTYEDSLDVHPYSGHRLRQQPPPLPPPPPHVVNAKSNLNSDVLSSDEPPSQPLPPPPPPKNIAARLTAKSEVPCCRIVKRRVVAPLPSVDEIRTAYAWTALSTLYGRALVILQIFFALTDVFVNADDDYNYPRYQRWLLLYSYCVAFVILVAIYICTLNGKWPPSNSSVSSLSSTSISNCSDPECRAIAKGYLMDADADSSSLASGWSTLRRAYIRRQGLTATGFSLRLAALVYGVATLIYFGFELAVNTADEKRCVDDIDYALPILAVVFSFLQIHCLFVNAQVLSASFYGGAHFCFVHLVATNVVLWLRTISRQAATDWLVDNPNITSNVTVTVASSLSCASNNPLCEEANIQFYPELRRLASLRLCLMNSTLGQMWLQATPFLLPLQLQFFVVSAAVFYVMWESVGCPLRRHAPTPIPPSIRRPSEVDNKGIFVGLLLLVGGVVVLVMYLVLRARPQFTHDSLWVVSGTLSLVLGSAVLATLSGFLGLNRAPRLASIPTSAPLDKLLLSVTSLGPSTYALGGIVAGAASLKTNEHLLVLAHGSLLLVQSALQDVYIGERECRPNFRAGRRVALVLLFSNTALWLLDTFMTGGADSQKPQMDFYGVYAWAAIAYIAVPLTALYRLHAAVRLYEIWNRG